MRVPLGTAIAVAAVVAGACSSPEPESKATPAPAVRLEPPSVEELRSATYAGFDGVAQPITLGDGKWEDPSKRIAIVFARDFRVTGDLDGAPPDEAVVMLTQNRGGSGTVPYLAVVSRRDGKLVNVATAPLGDRVQLREIRIENRRIVAAVLQAGSGDAMCCPGELASRTWEIAGATLRELPAATPPSRLSLDTIAGITWVLRSWDLDETAPVVPEITLQYKDGRFAGVSGCNNYSAAVKSGRSPGDIVVSPPAGTRKACAEDQMAIEQRFLQLVGHVNKYGFMLGQLMLSYQDEGKSGALLFDRK